LDDTKVLGPTVVSIPETGFLIIQTALDTAPTSRRASSNAPAIAGDLLETISAASIRPFRPVKFESDAAFLFVRKGERSALQGRATGTNAPRAASSIRP